MAKSPAQEAIERINARVSRIGAAPRRMPTRAGFEQQGYSLDKISSQILRPTKAGAEDSDRGGGSTGRGGDTAFDSQTGEGRLERTLRSAVSDINEARDNGDLSADDADRMLRKAAEISENLYNVDDADAPDWATSEDALKAVLADSGPRKRSGIDRVLDTGGNVLLEGLRQASRPGQATMSYLAEMNRQGEANPIKAGPVKINRGILAPVELMLPGSTGLDMGRAASRTVEGAALARHDSPGTILNETADIRESKGQGRGYFGSDIRDVSNDWIINNPVTDVAVTAAVDPLTYVGFGTGRVARGAMGAADRLIPGAGARLRQGGLEALTAGERATLAQALPSRAMEALKGAQGGIRVRSPFGRLAEGETVVAGRTLGKPFRAVAESGPAGRLAGTRAAEAVTKVGHAVQGAFVPRAALQRELGDQVGRAFDDIRVGLGHTAGQQAQRWVDRAITAARSIPDLTVDDLKAVGQALDVGGDVAQLPPRLKPLADEMMSWRDELTGAQREAGVLVDPADIEIARQGRVDKARATVTGLEGKRADIQRQIDERLAQVEPVVPDLAPAARRATDAGYAGGQADMVLEGPAVAEKAVDRAQARVAQIGDQTDRRVAGQLDEPVLPDAPISSADRAAVKEVVNDMAADAAQQLRDTPAPGVTPLRLPTAREAKAYRGGEWDWVTQLSPEDRAAYQRWAAAEGVGGKVGDAPLPGRQTPMSNWQAHSASIDAPLTPDQWAIELGVDTADEAAEIVMDRVRRHAALDQVSRGYRPWFDGHYAPNSPLEAEILQMLPVENIKGYAGRAKGAGPKRTALGQAVAALDKLVPGATAKIRELGFDDWYAGLNPEQQARLIQGWTFGTPKKIKGGGFEVVDRTVPPLTDAQWRAIDNATDLRTDPFVHTTAPTKTAGRGDKNWGGVDVDELVRAHRQSIIDENAELVARGDIDPFDPTVAPRAEGRLDEAEMRVRETGRAKATADARAKTAAGRAEAAADRAVEAEVSINRQTARAAEQSLERGKKAATMPNLNRRLAAVKRDVKAAEKELAEAEAAFERGVVADEDYLPRILTPAAVKVMNAIEEGKLVTREGVTGVRSSVVGDSFVTARKAEWADMSIAEINAEMAGVMDDAVQAKILRPDEALDWFDPNPLTAFATRDATARRHIISKQFYETLGQLRDDTGEAVMRRVDDLPDLPDGFGLVDQPIPVADALRYVDSLPAGTAGARERLARAVTGSDDWVFMDVPSLGVGVPSETVLVRREIADELTKVTTTMLDSRPLMRFIDQWQALWKSYATVPLPFGLGFHLRNAQGNVFLNWLAGMTDIGAYVRAAKLQRAATKGLRRFGDPFHFVRGTPNEKILRDALDNGVIGEGFFDVEIGPTSSRTISDTRGRVAVKGTGKSRWRAANPFSTDFALIAQGRKLGSSVENNARLAHFMWSMDRLGDPLEAARSVRHTLFDYSDLTPFERTVMRRFIPFYTFMRKSAPVVIEGFATNPHRLSRIQQLRMSLAEDAEEPQGLYPKFLTEGGAIPLGMSLGDDQIALMPDLPVLSTAENLTDALAVAGALPVVPNVTGRTPTEGAQGLLGLIGGGAPGAASSAFQVASGRRLFGGSELHDKPIDASLPARALGLARDRDVNGDGTLEASMTPKSDFLLESLFPLASKVPFGNPSEEDKSSRRLISMLSGLRVYPLGDSTRNFEGYRRQDELMALLQSWYDQGLLVPGDDDDERDRRELEREAG